jgi:hypothetical protein
MYYFSTNKQFLSKISLSKAYTKFIKHDQSKEGSDLNVTETC